MTNEEIANEITNRISQNPILSYVDLYKIILYILENSNATTSSEGSS